MEYAFKCPECDQALVNENNVKTKQNMERLINRLNEEIQLLGNMEIKIIKERKLTRTVKKKKKVRKILKIKKSDKKIKQKKKKRR